MRLRYRQCHLSEGFQGETSGKRGKRPVDKIQCDLNKGTLYKFTVCNAEGYEGKAVIKLTEGPNVLGTNLKPDGSFQDAVGFQCNKTGMYILTCGFKGGKEGAAVVIMSYMNK